MTDAARRTAATGRRPRPSRHGDEAPIESEPAADDSADLAESSRQAARERVHRAIASGDYDGLLDPALWQLFDRAARTEGFSREIGALRFAMARLLAEENDPRHLATHLTRVTTTIIRAAQAQRAPADAADPVRDALLEAIGDLEGDDDGPDDASDTDEEGRW